MHLSLLYLVSFCSEDLSQLAQSGDSSDMEEQAVPSRRSLSPSDLRHQTPPSDEERHLPMGSTDFGYVSGGTVSELTPASSVSPRDEAGDLTALKPTGPHGPQHPHMDIDRAIEEIENTRFDFGDELKATTTPEPTRVLDEPDAVELTPKVRAFLGLSESYERPEESSRRGETFRIQLDPGCPSPNAADHLRLTPGVRRMLGLTDEQLLRATTRPDSDLGESTLLHESDILTLSPGMKSLLGITDSSESPAARQPAVSIVSETEAPYTKLRRLSSGSDSPTAAGDKSSSRRTSVMVKVTSNARLTLGQEATLDIAKNELSEPSPAPPKRGPLRVTVSGESVTAVSEPATPRRRRRPRALRRVSDPEAPRVITVLNVGRRTSEVASDSPVITRGFVLRTPIVTRSPEDSASSITPLSLAQGSVILPPTDRRQLTVSSNITIRGAEKVDDPRRASVSSEISTQSSASFDSQEVTLTLLAGRIADQQPIAHELGSCDSRINNVACWEHNVGLPANWHSISMTEIANVAPSTGK